MKRHKIHWISLAKTTEVADGQTILDAALDNEVDLNHACGGFCACTTCHIYVKEGAANLSVMDEEESERLEYKDGRTTESRLSCQSKVHGDIAVVIP
ncbi:MAG: 2Fe-2S iron-sulfur cluster-binding protein [Bdellovibrionota bacterium]